MPSAYWQAYRHLFSMLDDWRRMSRGGGPVSRFHSIAAAIVAVILIAGCNATASPGASVAPKGTTFKDINVNILTFNGPQVAEPLQRRAPDFEQLTGAHVNVVAVCLRSPYDKTLLATPTKTNALTASAFYPP